MRKSSRPKPDAARFAYEGLDRVIHERLRLGIISALAVNDSLTFNELKHTVKTSDGNLSVHARKLEEAGYVSCSKTFAGRTPNRTSSRKLGSTISRWSHTPPWFARLTRSAVLGLPPLVRR